MAKWWNKTITVYHRNGTEWQRNVCENCYYGTEARQVINGLTLSSVNSTFCSIPLSNNISLSVGDIVVLGDVSDAIPENDSGNTLKKKYAGSCFTVGVVRVNADVLPHVLGGVEN